MIVQHSYSHRGAEESLQHSPALSEVVSSLTIPGLALTKGSARNANQKVQAGLTAAGWVIRPKVAPGLRLDINAMKASIGFTMQTGNVARAFYDLMKFQAMKDAGRLNVGVLAVPTLEASRVLGSNVASFERISSELRLFSTQITLPVLLLGLDEE